MIITLTEMGPDVTIADVDGKRQKLTDRIQRLIDTSGRIVWETDDFGNGKAGEQAQYLVDVTE